MFATIITVLYYVLVNMMTASQYPMAMNGPKG